MTTAAPLSYTSSLFLPPVFQWYIWSNLDSRIKQMGNYPSQAGLQTPSHLSPLLNPPQPQRGNSDTMSVSQGSSSGMLNRGITVAAMMCLKQQCCGSKRQYRVHGWCVCIRPHTENAKNSLRPYSEKHELFWNAHHIWRGESPSAPPLCL